MRWLIGCLSLLLLLQTAHAEIRANNGEYTVTAFMILKDNEGTIYVNPMTRSRYFLKIQNPESTAKMMKAAKYLGQVTVTFELMNPQADSGLAVVRKIHAIKIDKLPEYDGAFEQVKQ